MIRRGLAAAAATLLAAMTVLPVGPANAAALPRPRSEQWWFPAWTIEDKVWPLTRGAGVTVAVIDTGVNASLPGLKSVVLPGTDIDHQGGDGRTDTDTKDGGHGTAMTELIAGQGQDDGMVGLAPEAKILPIVAGRYLENIRTGIRFAADHGAKVINISQGFPDGLAAGRLCASAQDAVAYAARKDAVVVAAAGNEGNARNDPEWPADCAGVLAVGAVNDSKIPWTNTERQSYVSVAAPGIQVGSVWKNGRFGKASGTSLSAALASAAVALIRAKNPNLSAREVVQRIINTAIDAGPHGHDDYTGSGVMIPLRAINTEVAKDAPNPPYEALDKYLATKKQPPLGKPTGQQGKPAAAKKSSNSGLVIAIVVVAILAVVATLIVVALLMRRRRGGSRPVVQAQQPFPSGTGQFPSGPGPYGGYQDAGSDPRVGRPQGPPPSFRPPEDRRGPQN